MHCAMIGRVMDISSASPTYRRCLPLSIPAARPLVEPSLAPADSVSSVRIIAKPVDWVQLLGAQTATQSNFAVTVSPKLRAEASTILTHFCMPVRFNNNSMTISRFLRNPINATDIVKRLGKKPAIVSTAVSAGLPDSDELEYHDEA